MARHVVKMPDVGEGVTEAEIVAWHVKAGDTVEEDQDLVDVMTDKATVEIPSPVDGVIVSVAGSPGETIAVGAEIIVIEISEASGDAPASEDADEPATEATPVPAPARTSSPAPVKPAAKQTQVNSAPDRRPLASPAVRQQALEHDVDLEMIEGSGPAGRILSQDLEDFVAAGGRAIVKANTDTSGPTRKKLTRTEDVPIIGLRRKIAQNMERAWREVPHITYVEAIDVTDVETLRGKLNEDKTAEQPKLTLIPFSQWRWFVPCVKFRRPMPIMTGPTTC